MASGYNKQPADRDNEVRITRRDADVQSVFQFTHHSQSFNADQVVPQPARQCQ